MKIEEAIKSNILQLRKNKSLTQKEFGNIIGVSNSTVQKWENGTNTPAIETLEIIANKFSCPLNELLGLELHKHKEIVNLTTIKYVKEILLGLYEHQLICNIEEFLKYIAINNSYLNYDYNDKNQQWKNEIKKYLELLEKSGLIKQTKIQKTYLKIKKNYLKYQEVWYLDTDTYYVDNKFGYDVNEINEEITIIQMTYAGIDFCRKQYKNLDELEEINFGSYLYDNCPASKIYDKLHYGLLNEKYINQIFGIYEPNRIDPKNGIYAIAKEPLSKRIVPNDAIRLYLFFLNRNTHYIIEK